MPHSHTDVHGSTIRYLGLSVAVTLAFVAGEAIVGYASHSLALMSDAGHNFADALALVFSAYGVWISRRPSDSSRTFGYHRVGILAALVNAAALAVLSTLIFLEAIVRLGHPEPIRSGPMIAMALIAIVLNVAISLGLHGAARHDLNLRSAYVHMLGDAVSSFGVVIAGAAVALTGALAADAIVSFLIGGLILWSSWGILVEAVNVLMEAAPAHLDMSEVEIALDAVTGVVNVHDLHVWTLASGIVACSCHLLVDEQSVRGGQQVLRDAARVLERRFGIAHTTVQVEVEGCDPNEMYCTMRQISHDRAGHDPGGDPHAH